MMLKFLFYAYFFGWLYGYVTPQIPYGNWSRSVTGTTDLTQMIVYSVTQCYDVVKLPWFFIKFNLIKLKIEKEF